MKEKQLLESPEAIKDVIFFNLFLTGIQELYYQKKTTTTTQITCVQLMELFYNKHINFTTMEEKLQNIQTS